jgi:O-methyltransferase
MHRRDVLGQIFTSYIRPVIRRFGFDVVRYDDSLRDLDEVNLDALSIDIFDTVKEYTTTGLHRVDALVTAVRYVVEKGIGGDMVECGVWKGGSVMAIVRTLIELGSNDRDIYLYDLFSHDTAPPLSGADVSYREDKAQDLFSKSRISETTSYWFIPVEEVKENVFGTGYARERFHFVSGQVEDTIPEYLPEKIALLRLDTDFYKSTKHELVHLFPRLSIGGVLLVDDYGHWQGAKRAVDEYFSENDSCILLNRIDYTGRVGVKLGQPHEVL